MGLTGAVVYRWGAAVRGREGKALEVLGAFLDFFDGLTKSGRVHGHREFLAVTGRPGGLLVVEGDLDELLALQADDMTLRLRQEAASVVEDFDSQVFAGGSDSSLQRVLRDWAQAQDELGYL